MAVRLFEGDDHAASYLQFRVAPHELIPRITGFMQRGAPQRFTLAVDVGCGPGQGTVLLAPHFETVVGTDVSQAMVDRARAKSNPPNVSYRQCPAEELPFPRGGVDLLSAMTAAHWFDRSRFLQEADRVLRPGGCLALLSYSMDMELEFGGVSDELNAICQEFYGALLPFRSPYLGKSSKKIYLDMFNSCSYTDKEWNECVPLRRSLPLSAFIGMWQTFSSYQLLKKKDPAEAEQLSNNFLKRLLSAMSESSADTEVTVSVHYFYWLACKPQSPRG